MQDILHKITSSNWNSIADDMHRNGYAILPGALSREHCDTLKAAYEVSGAYRKTVVMERYRFGLGEYRYFNYPLPDVIQVMRSAIYPHLAAIANTWFHALQLEDHFPLMHEELLQRCTANKQDKATPLILKYGKGGFNTLHQDLYGDVYFPIQAVCLLSQPGEDFTGGEFVLTQQIPRAQSKAIVLSPNKGDLLIFTTNFRPEKGTKGYYRLYMKHGVSEVRSGERYALGIIFHDALS